MKTRRTHGVSLLEVLFVVGISAMVVGSAAVQFRTLRQVSDLSHRRREALQNARVALQRLASRIRIAKRIAAITSQSENAGSITITDFNDTNHVFSLVGTEVRYGIDSATDLLATGIQALRFQGYGAQGAVPPEQPAGIDSVQVSLTAAIAESAHTISVTTQVRLRREVDYNQVRSTTSYASTHNATANGGLINPDRACGEPDGNYASCKNDRGGKFYGFPTGEHAGDITSIYAGLRMRSISGGLQMIIRHNDTVLFDHTYAAADFDPSHTDWGWWWIDLTKMRAGWTEADIDKLSIEVRDPGPDNTHFLFDCFAIYALFDPAVTTLYWADREGSGQCPNDWGNASDALGPPDDAYAQGQWASEDWQSFAFPVPDSNDLVVSIHLLLEGYITSAVVADALVVRTALPAQNKSAGAARELVDQLNAYVGPQNEGTMEVDLTNDRAWTWDDLRTHELRIHLDRRGDAAGSTRCLYADAVGWRVVHRAPPERGIRIWSEP